jgi:anti-sigma28 factor (negative regulator of flagellin synthesis)
MSDRGEKVEQLRQALQDGTYQRDDHEVAAALLDDVAARSRLLR